MLKKTFFLLLLTLGLSSCNIEEFDSDDISALQVNGVWKLTELNLQTPLDINADNTANSNILEETGIIDATLIFEDESNGTIFYRSWVGFSSMESENKLHFLPTSALSSDHAPEPFAYSLENGLMKINTDITYNRGYNETTELIFEGNTLTFTVPSGFIVKDEITLEESVNQDLTYIFTRQ